MGMYPVPRRADIGVGGGGAKVAMSAVRKQVFQSDTPVRCTSVAEASGEGRGVDPEGFVGASGCCPCEKSEGASDSGRPDARRSDWRGR